MAPTAPPSTKVLSRCLSSTLISLRALRVILTAFCAGDGDPLPGCCPIEEHRRGVPAGPVGYPRDPVGHDLDGRVRRVLYGEVLDDLHTGPGGTLDDVVVDLAYLLEVGDVLLCGTAHRRAERPDVEARAVHVLVRQVDHERAHVRVVAVAVEDDLGHEVNTLDHEVRPLLQASVNDGLDADGDLGEIGRAHV